MTSSPLPSPLPLPSPSPPTSPQPNMHPMMQWKKVKKKLIERVMVKSSHHQPTQ